MSKGKVISLILSIVGVLTVVGLVIWFLSEEKCCDKVKEKAGSCKICQLFR